MMTTHPSIRVEGLGKKFRRGRARNDTTVRDVLSEAMHWPINVVRSRIFPDANRTTQNDGTFWALQDISFAAQPGEVLGLIGRNGSGKTTLLKILSRISRPSAGYFEVRGRLGAMLEVGTGFHPDLTGRENVYLNGSILGMRRAEIAKKFDSIVEFAGVEPFIDTAVKHYSSGMYVRLAFAVAAHLDTDILLMDEVLSVGDIAFQKKSQDKMLSVAKDGRTVVLVSHSMETILQLCDRVILLQEGHLKLVGNPKDVVSAYEDYEYAQLEAEVSAP